MSDVNAGPAAIPFPAAEPESPILKAAQKTPWWFISVGLHALAVLILAVMVVIGPAEERIDIFEVGPPQPRLPVPDNFDPPVHALIPIIDPDAPPVENPIETRERDKSNEDPDREIFGNVKGNPEFETKSPFDSKNRVDSIGMRNTGSGRKGGPFGGRKLREGKGPAGPRARPETEKAVLSALLWLARHQSPDGSWAVQGHTAQCKGKACSPNPSEASADFDTGVTGLALLAFLGAGYSHLSRDTHEGLCFGDVVKKALQWTLNRQDAEGFFGSRLGHKAMYNHAIAALAVCEAYGLSGSALFQENAQRSIDALVAAQNPGKGWRYTPRSGDSDTSVTGWAVMALKSAELSGLSLPPASYAGARAWLDEVTETDYGRAGYTHRGTGKVYCPHNAHFDHQEALTAIAVMSRIFIDRNPADANLRNGAHLIARDIPSWDGPRIDFYAWYYQALALFQVDGPSGPLWSKWNKGMVEALVKPQNAPSSGCKSGSWEPVDRWSCEGGRVYATAINALTLEVYYRYDRVFTGKDRKDM
jgi:hypothetical protein